jgi:hypothetical protein
MRRTDSITGLPVRQYVAAYGIAGARVFNVRVIGIATDTANREAVSEEIEETTRYVPEFITQVPVTRSADMEIRT